MAKYNSFSTSTDRIYSFLIRNVNAHNDWSNIHFIAWNWEIESERERNEIGILDAEICMLCWIFYNIKFFESKLFTVFNVTIAMAWQHAAGGTTLCKINTTEMICIIGNFVVRWLSRIICDFIASMLYVLLFFFVFFFLQN